MQPVRFCSHGECFEAAIRGARATDKCRTHYRELLAAADDLVACEVTTTPEGLNGEASGVTDAITNETVRPGGTVTLDPRETNIAALVAGGIVRVIPSPAAKALKGKAKD